MTDPAVNVQTAIDQLRNHQKQLDMDGVFVGVSRQAIDEVLQFIEGITDQLAIRDAETTRRALEGAAKALVNSKILVEEYSPYTSGKRCGADDQIQSGHDAILALQPAPTGWKLVPEELPAENNKEAVKLALSATVLNWPDYMNSLYRVMIGSVK
jgi:hypothetical protein